MRDCVGERRGRCGRENGRVLERGEEYVGERGEEYVGRRRGVWEGGGRRGVCGREEGGGECVGGRREEGSVWDNEEECGKEEGSVERRRGAYGTENGEVWKGERRVWDRGGGGMEMREKGVGQRRR